MEIHPDRVATGDAKVLITGESGVGKDLIAREIHARSARAGRPCIAVNCAGLTETLLESELFGHVKGSFTGAYRDKPGKLQLAHRGTLFLDEVGEMSLRMQALLLRFLENGEIQAVGADHIKSTVDVRVVAATNRNLESAIAKGEFREDLYYRLNVFQIAIPALRERPDDILPLAESFLAELGRSMGRPAAGISRDARDWLLAYGWPGNVRELRNAIERAILLCDGGLITREHLPVERRETASAARRGSGAFDPAAPLPAGGVNLGEMESSLVVRALRDSRGNKSKAARLLGLTRAQLYSRLDKYQLHELDGAAAR